MKDKKKIVIGTLCALIMIMAVGYALLSQQLSINGSAAITSNWQVEITNIRELEKSTGTTTNNTNYTATTASFNTSLTSPGDYATYEVTVTNKGTLDAVLAAKPTVTTGDNAAIQYSLDGIKKGDKILKNNQTDTFTITVTYNPETTTQPSVLTSDLSVTLNYQQDLGQVSPYDGYAIGDQIQFAGSTWYVIKDSTSDEDYVTLMKEKILTNAELGDYGLQSISGEKWDTMPHYVSSTCYSMYSYKGTIYSRSGSVEQGCTGHNDYAGSEIKEFLEGTYINTLGANKLKQVDGYKIRLITKNELFENLGYASQRYDNGRYYVTVQTITDNTPTWVYQNYGEMGDYSNNVYGYWTMTPYNAYILGVSRSGSISETIRVFDERNGVRPVINLLKSEI